jgi:hypothetical protein
MWSMWQLQNMLEVELQLGLLENAERSGRMALEQATGLEDERVVRSALVGLALVALDRGDLERAGTLWGAVDAAERDQPLLSLWDGFADSAAPLAGQVEERFREATVSGAEQPLSHAVALALAEPSQTSP